MAEKGYVYFMTNSEWKDLSDKQTLKQVQRDNAYHSKSI